MISHTQDGLWARQRAKAGWSARRLESMADQTVLRSTRDPALKLGAAARGVPSLRTQITFSPLNVIAINELFPPVAHLHLHMHEL